MNYEKAMEWVAALRSGEFEQGRTALTRRYFGQKDKDCCLGVACKLAIRDGLNLEQAIGSTDRVSYDYSADYLPLKVRDDWGDFVSFEPFFTVEGELFSLADLNDAGFTFDQIADLIQYFWREL